MRKLTEDERRLCSQQAQIFEESVDTSSCGSAVFVRRFMHSSLARRMDSQPIPLEQAPIHQLVKDVDDEFGDPYGSEAYSPEEMHWMGYLYRYWCCAAGKTSKAVYRIVGAREMHGLYTAYHTLDPAQAIERILESKGWRSSPPNIEYAVVRMREIRAKRQ